MSQTGNGVTRNERAGGTLVRQCSDALLAGGGAAEDGNRFPPAPFTASSSPDSPVSLPERATHPGLADFVFPVALLLVLVLLYSPVVAEAANMWLTDDNYSHGIFVFPVAIWILWMQRRHILKLAPDPTWWGLLPLGLGLFLETVGYLSGSRSVAMLSLVPVLAGAVLILHGRKLWAIASFPICFLAFAARMPSPLVEAVSRWAQHVSTLGAAFVMRVLGYAIIQRGNILEIPGVTLEVADVCSGLKKVIALVAFALLYGYLFRLSLPRRVLLAVAAIPIAVLANVIRISGLIAVTSAGGIKAFHAAHDGAEMAVLVIAFVCFVTLGKWLGCEKTRFSQ